jgi:hypothetical protein
MGMKDAGGGEEGDVWRERELRLFVRVWARVVLPWGLC